VNKHFFQDLSSFLAKVSLGCENSIKIYSKKLVYQIKAALMNFINYYFLTVEKNSNFMQICKKIQINFNGFFLKAKI